MNEGLESVDPVEAALKVAHIGSIRHHGPGRTDDTPLDVKAESFVIPADVVSGLGQGNTEAGLRILERMFPDKGIERRDGGAVPIIAAGGEFVVPPEHVARAGGGDIKKGHEVLREFVKKARSETIRTLKKLPGPARG